MTTIDFAKDLKDLYSAKRTVEEIKVDAGVFLAVDGQGAPGGEAFEQAIQAIYPAVFTLKFACKAEGEFDFKVSKLECLYFSCPETPRDQWQWRFLVRVPEQVTAKHLAAAKKAIREKKGLDVSAVKRLRWKEGRAVQMLHVGPYDKLCESYDKLIHYAQEHGLEITGPGHEIYLSDPRAAAPEKLKTIVRLGVRRRA